MELPQVFHGTQIAALPGPPFLPIASQNVRATIERPSDVYLDPKARMILSTLGVIPDALTARFFSSSNIDHLQDAIMLGVKKTTGVAIQRQSEHDLVLIMRSFYMRNTDATLASLNEAVVGEAMKIISDNLDLHVVSQKSVQRSQVLMERPISTNIAGTKFYEQQQP